MTPSSSEPPAGGAEPAPEPQAGPGERRVRDKRQPWRVWVPTYVIRECGAQLGPHGISIYLSLAWHLTREASNRWPSLQDIADQVGCSRSTVERTMRILRTMQLLETTACIDRKGQRSNYYDLIDPPNQREPPSDDGMELAGPVPRTGGRRPEDGGAPSQGRRPPVCETAPSVDPELKELCGNTAHTPSAPPSAPQSPPEALQKPLIDAWKARSLIRGRAARAEMVEEIAAEAAELLRRGFGAAELLASIQDPARDRSEYPRQWRARLLTAQIATAEVEETPAERVARQAVEREREAAELLADTRPVPKFGDRKKRVAGE